jgi:hypothetical protein
MITEKSPEKAKQFVEWMNGIWEMIGNQIAVFEDDGKKLATDDFWEK